MTIVYRVQFLPTYCRSCGAVALAQRSVKHQLGSPCAACGGQAYVVPGPSFGAHEQVLFDELTAIARRGQVRPAEAQRLCMDIELGLARADQPGTLDRVTRRFPELATMAPRLADSPARQARTLRMLETILNALAIPGKSVTLPAMPQLQQRKAQQT